MSWFMTDEKRRRELRCISRALKEFPEEFQPKNRVTLEELTRGEWETPGKSNKKEGD